MMLKHNKADFAYYLDDAGHALKGDDKTRAMDKFSALNKELGGMVGCYPTWHPLAFCTITELKAGFGRSIYPDESNGWKGLHRTRLFTHGFLALPYEADVSSVLTSAELFYQLGVIQEPEVVDFPMSNDMITPIVIRAKWRFIKEPNKPIPLAYFIGTLLSQALYITRSTQKCETYAHMRQYFVGEVSNPSPFVTKEDEATLRSIWEALNATGMWESGNELLVDWYDRPSRQRIEERFIRRATSIA